MDIEPDKRLQADVMNELKFAPGVIASHIGVVAKDGAVTLTGHVPSYAARRRAVEAAERVYAVRAVADDLDVQLPTARRHGDSDIAEAIAHTLRWNVDVPRTVEAEVAKGWVTLRGVVEARHQKLAAEQAVEHHAGIRGVANLIEVRKPAKARDVQRLINSAFQRNASLDARRVRVLAKDGTVRLQGTVHSVSEARAAREAALSAPGVNAVDSQLLVVP